MDAGLWRTGATVGTEAHRKVVMYRIVADDGDQNGHGTHVAGTIIGHTEVRSSPSRTREGERERERGPGGLAREVLIALRTTRDATSTLLHAGGGRGAQWARVRCPTSVYGHRGGRL